MNEQPNNEKCRFCDSRETFREFHLTDTSDKWSAVYIKCEPICFNCIKERALKGEPI